MYNAQRNESGNYLPLMMGFIMPSPIEINEIENVTIYDPESQTTTIDMRFIGTFSLRLKPTYKPGRGCMSDNTNSIDDTKSVN